ncbi:MAG: hypothetical protein ACK5MQ_11495, partial [Pikeienuella sp.]
EATTTAENAAPEDAAEAAEAPGPGAVIRAPAPRGRPAALDMTPSERIATRSPTPNKRPRSIRPRESTAAAIGARGVREVAAPRRPPPQGPGIANAATLRDVISLGEMNLLGVFGAGGSRRALLRLPDGQVLRVTRGTVVDGWVVSRIDASSMRITRGGRAKVLNLAQ